MALLKDSEQVANIQLMHLIESIKHYMKSRMMWISILVGLVSVPTFWAAIIWVSLILE